MENVFEKFTFNIIKLNKLVQKIKQREMDGYGLKAIHVMCAYYLYERKDGMTASELVKCTLEDKAAISRAIACLLKKGFVEYDNDIGKHLIKLTDSGMRFAEDVMQKASRAVEAGSADMTEEQRKEFYKVLDDIAKNLSAYYAALKR